MHKLSHYLNSILARESDPRIAVNVPLAVRPCVATSPRVTRQSVYIIAINFVVVGACGISSTCPKI